MKKTFLTTGLIGLLCAIGNAHDTWVQTNTNLVRSGDVVHIDLMLGNHGNHHRDFKLASKVELDACTFEVVLPGGERLDAKDQLVDTGYAPKEGFWTARFVPANAGLYMVGHTMNKVMSYAPVRDIKAAKTCFVVSPTLDKVSPDAKGFDRPLGHKLELVPLSNPVTPMGPGTPIRVQLLYRGMPSAGQRVSFIPRGEKLAEGIDEKYERTTNDQGQASFTPSFGTYYLVAAHRDEPTERGTGYDRTHYSATLTVYVPQVCACCAQ